ncbi:5-(carboxyamino)imidazole ribonucleotide synthase [soil metagenome]
MKIGVLGGGQLGRMLALTGYPLGLTFRFFDPSPDACAGEVGELINGNYNDKDALARFANGLDVVTYEFENVPVEAARFIEQHAPVHPNPAALEVAQDRLVEKRYFRTLNIPTGEFETVDNRGELISAIEHIGLPSVLKTRREGYDGKGQRVLRDRSDIEPAWNDLGNRELILEQFIAFDRELSIISVRSGNDDFRYYPLVENTHTDGILSKTIAPALNVSDRLQRAAEGYAHRVQTALDYVGVLAIELFEVEGRLLANEMAPRVHNSGHWSIEGSETSQFENHVRAVAGLPLGSTAMRGQATMLNLIGSIPNVEKLLAVRQAYLHLYGKAARPGRKLGHVTVRSDDSGELAAGVAAIADIITPSGDPAPDAD